MENNQKQRVKSAGYYLPRIIKFHELKDQRVPRFAFLVSLITYLITLTTSSYSLPGAILNIAVTSMASAVYLLACIRELRTKEYTLGYCVRKVFRKMLPVVATTFLTQLFILLGLVVLIVPGVLLMIYFSFAICYVVDLGTDVQSAFRASKSLSEGYRWQVFGVGLVTGAAVFIPSVLMITLSSFSGSQPVFVFVSAFITSVIQLMMQRLLAHLYVDLEYKDIHAI